MGLPSKPTGANTSRLRLARTTTQAIPGNTWTALAWESVSAEQNWGGTVTVLPASVIDVYTLGLYWVAVGLGRKTAGGGGRKTAQLRFQYDIGGASTETLVSLEYELLGSSVLSPYYGVATLVQFTVAGNVKVEYKCSQGHDVVSDDETFLEIVRVSD